MSKTAPFLEAEMKQLIFVLVTFLYFAPSLSAQEATSAPPADKKAQWTRPRSSQREEDRMKMVLYQIRDRGVRDKKVLAAMQAVPRHWFVPEGQQRRAYQDRALSIGFEQTISQPYIVAVMTASLDIDSSSKVLEIGTGSGYQAAVLNEITPYVYTIEIIEELGKRTQRCLKVRGYKTIETRIAAGYNGWPEEAPFDAIIVTAAATHVPPPLFKQLKTGGRMCIPIGPPMSVQELVIVTKDKDGKAIQKNLFPVRFVPLTRRKQ